MSTDIQAVFAEAMRLPEAERLALVSRLMESLPPADVGLSLDDPKLAAELDRRFAQNDEGIAWSELRAED